MSSQDLHAEPMDIRFTSPASTVISVRLNRDESRALTVAAREVGEKLSTFIKRAALEAAASRGQIQSSSVSIGGVETYFARVGTSIEPSYSGLRYDMALEIETRRPA